MFFSNDYSNIIEYRKYHDNPVNEAIHIFAAPVSNACKIELLNWLSFGFLPLGYILLVMLTVHALRYDLLTPILGVIILLLLNHYVTHPLLMIYGPWSILLILVIVFGFIQQYLGHVVFQKNNPKFADNFTFKGGFVSLSDSVYIWLLLIFMRFGYRPKLKELVMP